MADPFVAEIRMFAGTFAPYGWFFCDGTEIPISEYETLFTLIGTTYGGNGATTFKLPDLRSRIPLHQSNLAAEPYQLGQQGGSETVTLTPQQIPPHNHPLTATAGSATSSSPQGSLLASWSNTPYAPAAGTPVALAPGSIGATGGSQPHTNMPPFLAVNFIIAWWGIYPSQS